MQTLFTQNHLEHLKDQMEKGELTADQANVAKVKMARFQLVTKLPMSVRKALNAAVKTGELKRFAKDGHKPEVYFHPNFEYLARQARNEHERNVIKALIGVFVPMSELHK